MSLIKNVTTENSLELIDIFGDAKDMPLYEKQLKSLEEEINTLVKRKKDIENKIKKNQPSWKNRCPDWIHDDYNIHGFFGDYRFLSNFHLCSCFFEDMEFPSTENAYQAAKVVREDRVYFQTCTPAESKTAWKNYRLKYDAGTWDDYIKDEIMFLVNFDKYSINEELKIRLLNTEGMHLEETNWWKDKYWGVCNGIGKNKLGHTLMKIRTILKD